MDCFLEKWSLLRKNYFLREKIKYAFPEPQSIENIHKKYI